MSLEAAGVFRGAYTTAYHALLQRGRMQAGEWVLVHGAAVLEQEHPASELVQIHRMSRKIFPHGDSVHFSSEYSAIIKGAVLGVTRTAIVIQLLGVATKDQNGWIATVADRKILSENPLESKSD